MSRKAQMDAFGAVALVLVAALLGYNQVVIKQVNEGFQPVFFAGLRSAGVVVCLWLWMRFRGIALDLKTARLWGIAAGIVFSIEFTLLFLALDLSSVSRVTVIFNSMPVWLAIGSHYLLPGERLHFWKAVGLILAMAGVVVAMFERGFDFENGSFIGDICALGAAFGWAGITLMMRATPLQTLRPETQLFWQVLGSAVLLLLISPLFGPLMRDFQMVHLWGVAFQIVIVVTGVFLFWFWLLTIYPASAVASFGFLAPVFGVMFGWLILGESLGFGIVFALVLVAIGVYLINRPPKLRD
ncbi:MAG: DMT family transporter [Halocynthiibacter sp.]